jgi:hypothetical protein
MEDGGSAIVSDAQAGPSAGPAITVAPSDTARLAAWSRSSAST